MRYRHPELGFELTLPDGSELHDDMDGMAIVAVEPNEPSSGFRANLVVTVEEVGVQGLRSRATPRCPCAPRASCCSATG